LFLLFPAYMVPRQVRAERASSKRYAMSREKVEKLGTLFLAVFSTGLVAQFATTIGLEPHQWFGATAAVLGSLTVAVMVRVWRRPEPQRVTARDDRRER